MITNQTVAEKLADYLNHRITLENLVDWAESGMMEGEFDEGHHDAIRNAIARMGVADVRVFGLTWEDCQEILRPLGYSSRVEIAAIQD